MLTMPVRSATRTVRPISLAGHFIRRLTRDVPQDFLCKVSSTIRIDPLETQPRAKQKCLHVMPLHRVSEELVFRLERKSSGWASKLVHRHCIPDP